MKYSIRFFSEEIDFILEDKIMVRNWLKKVIAEENKGPLHVNYIFCSDGYLLELNKKYLNHSTLTDILTFPDTTPSGEKSGEIYISIDRIKENASIFNQPFEKELLRVMVHGILHLSGYNDKSGNEKKLMTRMEDYFLGKL